MKKIILTICALALCVVGFAQEAEKAEVEASPEMKSLNLAAQLAKYGYENSSAVSLIEAAKIFSEITIGELDATKDESKTETVAEKDKKISYNPLQLLADAKEMAGNNDVIIALVEQVEAKAKRATRGAVGGPKGMSDRVYGKSSESYHVKFWANEKAEVCLSGDGDTDLDLYIYDENWNLIGKDDDYSDDCVVRWYPKWTGSFIIKVVNRGAVYNNFVIWTN